MGRCSGRVSDGEHRSQSASECGRSSLGRVDIGGKLLTNYLKEMLSYRQLDLMGEVFIANDVKEKSCFVSSDYKRDMEWAR